MTERGHVSDEALVRLMDGELSSVERDGVQGHVLECEHCAARKRSLEATSSGVAEMLRAEAEAAPLHAAGLRVRVRSGIAAAPDRSMSGLRWSLLAVTVALPIVAVVIGWFVLRHQAGTVREAMLLEGLTVPDPHLTPGAIRPVQVEELCRESGEDFDPEVPAAVQQAVFQEYGMWDARTGEYQVDYLVSPQLGGTDSLANLWPEPYGTKVWNARAKDALEQRLRTMVCAGEIDLPAAQEAIRVDWIAAYRRYVGSGERLLGR